MNFAYTGNPSQTGLEWKPYTESGAGTMVFDAESEYRALDDREMTALMAR